MSDTTLEKLLAERDWLSALARSLVADAATADDIAQETWLTALRRGPRHRRSLRAWLATVLRSRARDAERRDQRERRRAERSRPAPDSDDPATIVAEAEAQQRVARLTLALPRMYRDVLLLRYWRGLRPAEIARRTGEPAGTVRSRIKRGLDLLRERLDADHDGDRRAWLLAILPLTRPTPRGTPTMLNVCQIVAVIGAALGGAALVVPGADAPPSAPIPIAAAVSASPAPAAPDGLAAQGVPAPDEEAPTPAATGQSSKRNASILDRKVSVDFKNLPLPDALEFLRDATGLRYELAPGFENSVLSLQADDIALRSLLDLLGALMDLEWSEREDGSIHIRRKAEKPATPKVRKGPWFGSHHGWFDPPSAPASVPSLPEIRLPGSDMGSPLTPALRDECVEFVISSYGRVIHAGKALGGKYAIWCAVLDRPGAPVLLRADLRAPAAHVLSLLGLTSGRPVWLAVDGGSGLRLPGARPEGTPDGSVSVIARRGRPGSGVADPEDVYRHLARVYAGNEGKRIDLHLTFGGVARVEHLAALLGEGVRFGFAVTRLRPYSGSPLGHETVFRYRITTPPGTRLSDEPVPPKQPGVRLARPPAAGEAPRRICRFLSGRVVRRNLRAEGGGAASLSALDRGTEWLRTRQDEDGSWGGSREDTVRAVLAILASGMTSLESSYRDSYRDSLDRGLSWLVGSKANDGLATIAFSESWALTGDPRWRAAAEAALDRTGSASALRIARFCGLSVTIPESDATGTTPADCFVRLLDGEAPWKSGELGAAMNAFLAAEPSLDDELLHDQTLVAFQAGGEAWKRWLKLVKPMLIDTQLVQGPEKGSWDPRAGDSRVKTTALRTATLAVFFRYPRLLRRAPE